MEKPVYISNGIKAIYKSLPSLYKLFMFICLDFKKDRLCWKILPTPPLQCCCFGAAGQCLIQHAQRCVESHSCFTLHSGHRGGAVAPGPRLAASLRTLCDPGLSTKLQGLPAKLGSQTEGGGCFLSQKNTCENPGNKFVFSVKGGLGCWTCQCYNCEALQFDCF